MAKPVKSQWDFGELFPTEATRKVLTVAELTTQVKRLLEKQVGQIWVTGEVTNLRAQGSGHIYFTLKDAESQLSCVLFRGEARENRHLLEDGRKVVLQGDVTVYEPRGQYQLRVTSVELQGMGALQAAFEKLKQRLNAEGLFAAGRKRALPRFPQRIGIVTSPTGAAIRDVLHVIQRRNPGLELVLVPCRVQGQGAAEEIAAGIRLLNEWSEGAGDGRGLDMILATRGGGSLEDLWAFNEEVLARAIFESRLPVMSAVGHEIDFTISDFVADGRAATPSAAAEIITEGVFSSCQFLSEAAARIKQLFRQRLEDKEYEVEQMLERLARVHPRKRFNEWLQRLDDLQSGLSRCAKQGARNQQIRWRNLQERLLRVRPGQVLTRRRELLQMAERRLHEQARRQLEREQNRVVTLETRLRLLGPEQVLARGYSITLSEETGKVIRAAAEVKAGQRLRTRLKSGEVRSVVQE
ncbi:MAG: Exodeoxyribonuclease 7 large subunit [Pedosphaera sp.]|nr:Exodeoxyribonuclease 7 large subunit [Pedosphaera sp.]